MKRYILFVLALTVLCILPLSGKDIPQQNPHADDTVKIIEKAYLHVDRESYYPGDDIWFKAYLIDASNRLLTANSANLHVELISMDSKIIDSRILRLDNGLGNGDFHLPEKLQSGRYRIRAYTNYMRNFGDQLFFNKDITVINSSDAAKTFSDSSSNDKNKLTVRFFPEGGSLVENVTSIVAFKAEDDLGYSHYISGEIYSSEGEKITDFKSTHNGMGTFMLKPATGLSYYAVIKNVKGELIRFDIPKCFSTGVAICVSGNKVGELLLTFKINPETLPLILDNDLSLTLSAHKIPFKTYSFRMKSMNSFLKLPANDLPEGIIMLTLSGLNNMPLCERLVYLQNNEDARINIETDKSIYNKRDSVSLKISLKTNSGIAQDAYLSLSATDYLFTDSSRFHSTISSWFLLESDVHGPVEEPTHYFDPSVPERAKDLDMLLLTQGWRDFEWKYKNMNYPPENGLTISGRVRKKFADIPLRNATVNIGIFDIGKPLIINVPTDSSGRFCLNGIDLTGSAKVIASVTGDNNYLKGWLLLDSARYTPASVSKGIIPAKFIQTNGQNNISADQLLNDNQLVKKNLYTYIHYSEIKNSIQRKYKLSDTIKLGEVRVIEHKVDWTDSPVTRSRHYLMGTPDYELKITPLDKTYSTAYKLINVRYLSQGKVPRWAYNPRIQYPLYMIDGRRAELGEVQALPLDWVERIDVVKNSAAMLSLRTLVQYEYRDTLGMTVTGYAMADGAISIILKDGVENKSVYHSSTMKFSGYNEPRIFYSPIHHKSLESDYKPDLRTTLFWEPNIKVEDHKDLFLKYFNSDNPSVVKIIVEGITTAGIPVTGKTEYEVK